MKNLSNSTPEAQHEKRALGIIYCQRPGTKRRWRKLQQLFKEKGVETDYIGSENSADAERIAAMMTRNGYRTIVVVGGDTALNYALNGIMKAESPTGQHPALGVIPAGYANDFAKYWGFEAKDDKRTIDSLLNGRRRRIDVGQCRCTTAKGEHTDYFLNCTNIGVAASIMGLHHLTFSLLGLRTISHLLSSFLLLFKRMSYELAFCIGGERFERRAMTLCIGSAHGYGQTPSAVPYNGQLDISLVTAPQATQLFYGLWLLLTGRFLSHKGISVWRTKRINFTHIGNAPISFDGRFAYSHVDHVEVGILPEEIEFLIRP